MENKFNPIKSLYFKITDLEKKIKQLNDLYAQLALAAEPDEGKSEEWFDGFRSACCKIAAMIRKNN